MLMTFAIDIFSIARAIRIIRRVRWQLGSDLPQA
jgi:hypothetical protein